MTDEITKRKTRYWNAYAVILSEGNTPVMVETFRSRERAYAEYNKLAAKHFKGCVSDVCMTGSVIVCLHDHEIDMSLKVVTNKVWKEGFEK